MCAQGITKELRGAPGQAPPGSGQVVEALGRARLVLRIFFSLNSPGLTEVRAQSALRLLWHVHAARLPHREYHRNRSHVPFLKRRATVA